MIGGGCASNRNVREQEIRSLQSDLVGQLHCLRYQHEAADANDGPAPPQLLSAA
eukprot:SAG22_NODE_20170_length_268_cov_0.568047_1_plen_53_part_10